MDNAKIFCGTSNVPLAKAVCKYLDVPLGKSEVRRFSDGEVFVEISESVRGSHVFVIQSTCPPTNEHIMELLIITDALKRASARAITAVIPYYGYARQDRKVQPRAPISAKLIADLITTAGISRVVTVDLHAGQIQGFFNIPVDNLFATPVLSKYAEDNFKDEIVVVSPDAGGVERARAFAKRLQAGLAIVDKRRRKPNVSEVMNIIGEVDGKTALLLDDMVDTAGTLTQAADALLKQGATKVYACCTHAVLSGSAIERIDNSCITEVVVTNSIPRRDDNKSAKIKYLSIGPLMAEAIRRIHLGESVSSLFR